MGDLVNVRYDDRVLVVEMVNAARHNVIDAAVCQQLAEAFRAADGVEAVVVLADGDNFSLGGDPAAFQSAPDPAEHETALADALHAVVRAMRDVPAPIVVGVRGWAAGAGMSLVLAADVVVAGTSAKLRPAYSTFGLSPIGGMTWTLPRIVGHRLARAILLGNQVLTASWAQDLGIVDDVVADEVVDRQAIAFAHRLADGPAGAMAGLKSLLQDSSERSLDEQLDVEAEHATRQADSAEGHEGVAAFVEGRQPDFRAARQRVSS